MSTATSTILGKFGSGSIGAKATFLIRGAGFLPRDYLEVHPRKSFGLGLVLGAMLGRCRERTLLALALLTAQASPSPPADRGLARKKSAPASPQAQERPSQQGW